MSEDFLAGFFIVSACALAWALAGWINFLP